MPSTGHHAPTVMPWYVEAEFAAWAGVDPAEGAVAYRLWRKRAVAAVREARELGYDVRIIMVRLAEFRSWLLVTQRRDDAGSRRAFILACAAKAGLTAPSICYSAQLHGPDCDARMQ